MRLNEDGNLLGRVCALALLLSAGFGVHRLCCAGSICPLTQADSCCAPAKAAAKTAAAAPPLDR